MPYMLGPRNCNQEEIAMETPFRSLVKALTWQALGLVTMTALTFALTGSLVTGGAVALGSAALGLVLYAAHERVWARIRWGLRAIEERREGPGWSL
jgi:uncharacterized membrane protein